MRFRAAYPHLNADRVCAISVAGWKWPSSILPKTKLRTASASTIRWKTERTAAGTSIHADLRADLPFNDVQFDHVVMLAVFEHLVQPEAVLREACRILVPGGSLIMTWPAAMVDPILNVLHTLHLISDEMESDEHQKRVPVGEVQRMLRARGISEFHHQKFELGLNNLMVATR